MILVLSRGHYCPKDQRHLNGTGITASMSRRGYCYDNAGMERALQRPEGRARIYVRDAPQREGQAVRRPNRASDAHCALEDRGTTGKLYLRV
jgi:hypothetical protein